MYITLHVILVFALTSCLMHTSLGQQLLKQPYFTEAWFQLSHNLVPRDALHKAIAGQEAAEAEAQRKAKNRHQKGAL